MTTRILEIGLEVEGSRAVSAELEFAGIEDKQIYTCDIDPTNYPDVVQDIREPFPEAHHGAYDIILCSHVLEHIEYRRVVFALENLLQCLKVGGEIIIVVPSLEWACDRIAKNELDASTFAVLYGGQGDAHDYHKCAFTLPGLVSLGEEFELETISADTTKFYIIHDELMVSGEQRKTVIDCVQNVYIGKKVK